MYCIAARHISRAHHNAPWDVGRIPFVEEVPSTAFGRSRPSVTPPVSAIHNGLTHKPVEDSAKESRVIRSIRKRCTHAAKTHFAFLLTPLLLWCII